MVDTSLPSTAVHYWKSRTDQFCFSHNAVTLMVDLYPPVGICSTHRSSLVPTLGKVDALESYFSMHTNQ